MKKIYFVRHGESEGNVGPFRQGPHTPLSQKGTKQAELVAKRLKDIPLEIVISSTYIRARQTAEIINNVLKKPIEHSDLLTERKRPTAIIDKHMDDPEVVNIEKSIRENFHKLDWKHSDEENFQDVKERALKAIKYIEERPEDNILIVTHGIFMKTLVSCLIMGSDVTSFEYEKIHHALSTDNTGISIIEKRDSSRHGKLWVITTWNDHAHLEDFDN